MTTNNKTYLAAAVVVVALVAGGVFALRGPAKAPAPPPPAAQTAPVAPAAPAPAPVAADCQPAGMPPPAPDGDTASAAEMKAGHDRIQAFVLALEAFQKCRDNQADHAGPNVTAAQKQAWIDEGDSAVDEANDLASKFAAQLALFKQRHPDQ